MRNKTIMIEVRDLHKNFGKLEVLRGINQTIKRGEKVVIIGPSGSGRAHFCVASTYWRSQQKEKYILKAN